MPKPMHRSRVMRKVRIRTTKGVKERYVKKEKGKKAHCGICGALLPGVSKGSTKTERRPSRKFGGTLCVKCMDRVIRYVARINAGEMKIDDVELRYMPYVKALVAQ